MCKLTEQPGFKYKEQLGKKTGSYEMNYQIGWGEKTNSKHLDPLGTKKK